MNIQNGTILKGTYKIIRFIASGGFGCTYEAEHIFLGKRVAIKEFFVADFCNRDSATSNVSIGVASKKSLVLKLKHKFIDEAKAIAQMSHPNIVSVSDVFEDKGTAYYVMDYIDGKSLAQIIYERGRLSEQDSLKIIKAVSLALKYVHSKNRLHLDIKPGNIMLQRDGRVFLIDFGVSKQYDEIDGQNTSTLMGYSSGYAPIEQMSNRVKNFTPATDIYALGATFYTLITGIMPPVDSTDRADKDTLMPLPKTISSCVRKAIEKAMNVSRSGRIQSIDEFLSILNNGVGQTSSKTQISKPIITKQQPQIVKNIEKTYSDGHEYIDLGLPSGTRWATCNIGASKPERYGDYYAWGETKEYSTSKSKYRCLLFWLKLRGIIDSNGNLTPSYDVAKYKWGGSWHMPTLIQIEELIYYTTKTWIDKNSVKGMLLTSKLNGNSIFLPAAGVKKGANRFDAGSGGVYIGATIEEINHASCLKLYNCDLYSTSDFLDNGYTVRPVYNSK